MLPIHVTVNCYNIPNNTEVFTEGYKILRVGIPQLASAVGGAKSDIYTLLGILNVFAMLITSPTRKNNQPIKAYSVNNPQPPIP